MAVPQGRKTAWDITLGGIPLISVRQDGVPVWGADPVPEVANKTPQLAEEERSWKSWHLGYGHADFLVPGTYHYATGDARFPRFFFMGPAVVSSSAAAGDVVGFFERGSEVWCLDGRYAKKLTFTFGNGTTTDDTVTLGSAGAAINDFGATAVASGAINFDANVFVSFSTGNMWQYTGAAWDEKATTPIVAKFLAKNYHDTAAVLWRALSTTAVDNIASGTADFDTAWSSTDYNIGETSAPITAMVGVGETLFIAKSDGLYYLDRSGRTPQIIKAPTIDANNGKGLYVDSLGRLWYPTVAGTFLYDPTTGTVWDVTVGKGQYTSGIRGTTTAVVQFRNWYYAAVYNGTNTYLMAGRDREQGELAVSPVASGEKGPSPILWHGPLATIASTKVISMHATSATTYPVLLMGAIDDKVYFCRLASTECPLDDSNYRYALSGSLYLPADDWGLSGTRWLLMGFEIEADDLSSTTYADLYAKLDHGDWQRVNSATINQAGKATISVPAAGDWRFTRVALRLDVTNANSASTPKLRAITGRAARRVAVRDLITTAVYCSDHALNRFGMRSRLSGADQLRALKELEEAGPTVLADNWTGQWRNRRVLVMPVRERLIKGDDDEAPAEQIAELSLTVLSDTVPAYYGTDRYGQGRYS